jgi:DNA-directed RNA polymerase subunit E"
MVKTKACKICNRIHDENKCPNCGSPEFTENFKGRVYVFEPEKSEIAQKLGIKNKGNAAIKTR